MKRNFGINWFINTVLGLSSVTFCMQMIKNPSSTSVPLFMLTISAFVLNTICIYVEEKSNKKK